MDRREFLVVSGSGVGLACLPVLTGCKSRSTYRETPGLVPCSYSVGDEHRIFDDDGSVFVLKVHEHGLHSNDAKTGKALAQVKLGDGPGQVNYPIDALDGPDDRFYVLDKGNSRVQVFDGAGRPCGVIGGHGTGPADLNMPYDMVQHGNRIYVCDTLNHRVQVYGVDGKHIRSIRGGSTRDALNGPISIAVASDGGLHVVDGGSATVRIFGADGKPRSRYGERSGGMANPRSIAACGDRRMYVADPASGFVHVFTEAGRFVGRFRPRDGGGRRVSPGRLTARPDGGLYIWTALNGVHPH